MKKILFISLLATISFDGHCQINRFTEATTTRYEPRTYDELLYDAQLRQEANRRNNQIENKKLNQGIASMLTLCEQQLRNPEYCYGDFRDDVYAIKLKLEKLNYRSETTGISLSESIKIYNQAVKEYNSSLKKHNKKIAKNLKKRNK